MAVTPKDSDTFLREVDDELRRERVNRFVARWGWYIVGALVAALAAVGGLIWWNHHKEVQAGEESTKLVQVIEQLDARNARGAAPGIDELAGSDRAGYRIAALFLRANAQVSTGAIPAAIETLKGIAADESAPQPFRDAALIRQTQLEFDSLNPQQVAQRLQPFVQAGNPWHGSAGEMLGIAMVKANQPQQAARIFEGLLRDPAVPDSIHARVQQFASSLGVDVVEVDPSVNQALEAAAAAPPPAAVAAPQANPTQPAPGAAPAQPKQ